MPTIPKQLFTPAALTATPTTTLYTVPAAGYTILKEVSFCNTDSGSRTVSLYVGTGSSAGQLYITASIDAYETRWFAVSTILSGSNTIKGGSNVANVVAVTISGVETT